MYNNKKIIGLFRQHKSKLRFDTSHSSENSIETLLCNPPVSPLQLSCKSSKSEIENIYIILTNNVPIGFTNNESDAREYILKFAQSLKQSTCKINRINDSMVQVVTLGYMMDNVNYTIRYDKISRLI